MTTTIDSHLKGLIPDSFTENGTCGTRSGAALGSRGRGLVLTLALLAAGLAPAAEGTTPFYIAAGGDGSLWFTENYGNKIGRITTAGVITEFAIPTTGSGPQGIAAGPDGNLWFVESGGNNIGRITTAGVVTEFPIPTAASGAFDVTSGPDGNLWFTENGGNKIARITTAGVITEFKAGGGPGSIAAGPDGKLWYDQYNANRIGQITTAGVVTGEFPTPTAGSGPQGIASGADGNLWFTEYHAGKVGRITRAGVVTEFTIPTTGSGPLSIAAGSDGNLWFTEFAQNKIGRITTFGTITLFPVPTQGGSPLGIAAGPDGNLWFAEEYGNKIGRITTAGVITEFALPIPPPSPPPSYCTLFGSALVVDPSLTGESDGNGIVEPGETVMVMPSWTKHFTPNRYVARFPCSTSVTETGGAVKPPGSAGDYVVGDGSAHYATFPGGLAGTATSRHQCGPTSADCYGISVMAPTTRPAAHWDTTLTETLRGTVTTFAKVWTLHIGDSFTDVPRSQPFYQKIETLLHKGITSGCSPTEYCPGQKISRGQIATFVAKGLAGSGANIPASGAVGALPYDCTAGGTSLFTDVTPTDMFCKQIHYIAAKNVDPGCAPGLYCSGDTVTRLSMASFVANALVAPGGAAAVPLSYGPDSVTGLSYSCDPANPNAHFTDVPESDPLCKHVNYLWARGIISGCSATEYCPTGEVTRDQMAKFLVNAFKLTLYGP